MSKAKTQPGGVVMILRDVSPPFPTCNIPTELGWSEGSAITPLQTCRLLQEGRTKQCVADVTSKVVAYISFKFSYKVRKVGQIIVKHSITGAMTLLSVGYLRLQLITKERYLLFMLNKNKINNNKNTAT